MARNLYDRSFSGLFTPLDHRQYAPPLYLVLAKACGELFGYGERSLRLPALLGGFLAIGGLTAATRTLKLGWWRLLPLALLFVSPTVLRFVGEVKPYALDLGLATVFLAWGLKHKQPGWRIALGGMFAIWASLPIIFILAAVGLHRFLPLILSAFSGTGTEARNDKNGNSLLPWLLTGAGWLISFSLLYLLVLAPSVGTKYLNVYHGNYFFPLPGKEAYWRHAAHLLLSLPKLAFGYTAIAIVMGALSVALAFTSRKYLWLLLPVLLVIIASGAEQYSLLPRLLLFILPGWWLLAAKVSQEMSQHFNKAAVSVLLVLWLIVLGGTNVARHFISPLSFSDSRSMVLNLEPGYSPVLHHAAVPAYDYYHRIHPNGKGLPFPAQEQTVQTMSSVGKKVLLYDVLTQRNIRESALQDSIWAAERGCEVRSVALFRAKAIYLDCPTN